MSTLAPGEGSEAGRGQPANMSAEAAISRELVELAEWLRAHGVDPASANPQADARSRDRLYWRYGYFLGLKRALGVLTGCGATLH